ncbi:fatty acid hydroxylase [Bombella apis]|nr:fatty acid hydroxylase [Bombella apis]
MLSFRNSAHMSESLPKPLNISDRTSSDRTKRKVSKKAAPVRIFQKDWMEAFTLISFRTFLIFCIFSEVISLIITFNYEPNFCVGVVLFLAGIFLWIITEYFLHRFLFHLSSENKSIKRLVYIFHGNHHIQPNHPYRTLMPIIVTLPAGLIIWAIFSYSLGTGMGSALFSGFFIGYTLYDCIHFSTHNFKMTKFPFSLWKRHHLLHHYKDESHNYSISFPWLDSIFKTRFVSDTTKKKR